MDCLSVSTAISPAAAKVCRKSGEALAVDRDHPLRDALTRCRACEANADISHPHKIPGVRSVGLRRPSCFPVRARPVATGVSGTSAIRSRCFELFLSRSRT